ncbi:MAG: DUF58 domain-containing protein [Chloroflexi bacterium]|nr:DUF58 domain-containing protein [Chloroflexota bacterium]
MLRRLIRPWILWRFRDGNAEISLIWHNRFPLLIFPLLLTLELIFHARVWKTLLFAFTSMMAIAAWWAWHMARSVRVRRETKVSWIQVGDLLEEHFTLTNDSLLPVIWIEVSDRSNVPGYKVSTVRAVGAHNMYRWSAQGECQLRGEYQLGPWEATVGDPFGLFTVVQRALDNKTILVYPPIARRLPFGLPRGMAYGRALSSHRSWDPTVSVGSVRAYVPGDPRQHIHWRTTARQDQLHTKEFDQETGGDIWLILDLDRDVQVGQGKRSTEEMGVIVTASVAALLLNAGRAVGLIVYGPQRQTVMPVQGRGHLWELLHVLAHVQATETRPLNHVLEEEARVLPVGATALVVTPSSESTWVSELVRLQGRGIGAAAVLLDAVSFSDDWNLDKFSPQVEALRGLLADARLESEIIQADTPLSLQPPTGQVRRWEFKVLGTGRVIPVSTPWGVR